MLCWNLHKMNKGTPNKSGKYCFRFANSTAVVITKPHPIPRINIEYRFIPKCVSTILWHFVTSSGEATAVNIAETKHPMTFPSNIQVSLPILRMLTNPA